MSDSSLCYRSVPHSGTNAVSFAVLCESSAAFAVKKSKPQKYAKFRKKSISKSNLQQYPHSC
jgi:hypothetical protein